MSDYSDRLVFTSHGGLPQGITEEEFFNGVSHPRNAVLMRILLNPGIVEHTGHGIPTIGGKYGRRAFSIHENSIDVTIPFEFDPVTNENVNTELGAINSESGAIQGGFGAIQEDFGTIQGGFGTIQEDFGAIQEDFGAVQEDFGVNPGASLLNPTNRPSITETLRAIEKRYTAKETFNPPIQLTENEEKIILELIKTPGITYNQLSSETGISRRSVSRIILSLVSKQYIERVGTNRTGHWIVKVDRLCHSATSSKPRL